MRISSPLKKEVQGFSRLGAQFASGQTRGELFYTVPVQYSDWFTTDRCDGFVVGLLHQSMFRGEDINVEGNLSSNLFHNLNSFYIPMMAMAFPNLHQIKIKADFLLTEQKNVTGVATGFSGGIDSFAAVVNHFVQESSHEFRITHFLFHNVGSHGHGTSEQNRNLFQQRLNAVRPYTEEVGIPLVPVDSNLADIFPINFQQMHHALNASVPLVLQNQFRRYFYASTYKYADCGVNKTDDIARFDPFAFHLLSTETLDCISTGCEMSRVEKTELVAAYEPSYRYLNVCVDAAFKAKNCSVCFKCCRTLLTLELLGKADLYKDVFDFQRFGQVRNNYIKKVIRYKKSSFEAEIADLARERTGGFFSRVLGVRKALEKLF